MMKKDIDYRQQDNNTSAPNKGLLHSFVIAGIAMLMAGQTATAYAKESRSDTPSSSTTIVAAKRAEIPSAYNGFITADQFKSLSNTTQRGLTSIADTFANFKPFEDMSFTEADSAMKALYMAGKELSIGRNFSNADDNNAALSLLITVNEMARARDGFGGDTLNNANAILAKMYLGVKGIERDLHLAAFAAQLAGPDVKSAQSIRNMLAKEHPQINAEAIQQIREMDKIGAFRPVTYINEAALAVAVNQSEIGQPTTTTASAQLVQNPTIQATTTPQKAETLKPIILVAANGKIKLPYSTITEIEIPAGYTKPETFSAPYILDASGAVETTVADQQSGRFVVTLPQENPSWLDQIAATSGGELKKIGEGLSSAMNGAKNIANDVAAWGNEQTASLSSAVHDLTSSTQNLTEKTSAATSSFAQKANAFSAQVQSGLSDTKTALAAGLGITALFAAAAALFGKKAKSPAAVQGATVAATRRSRTSTNPQKTSLTTYAVKAFNTFVSRPRLSARDKIMLNLLLTEEYKHLRHMPQYAYLFDKNAAKPKTTARPKHRATNAGALLFNFMHQMGLAPV